MPQPPAIRERRSIWCPEDLREEALLGGADFGKTFRDQAMRTVVLGEEPPGRRMHPGRHVPLGVEHPRDHLTPLLRGDPARLDLQPLGERPVLLLQQRHRGIPARRRDQVVEEVGQGPLVAVRKEAMSFGGKAIGVRRGANTLRGAVEPDDPLRLQLLQVMPHRVQRVPQRGRKIPGRRPTLALQVQQHQPAGTAVPDRSRPYRQRRAQGMP